ncbi:MAG TPA: hypothetical protein DD979_18395, partial [Gammaproteobacteria bacterium]|nr:hypothetical protein [Gammaproteobacteria bacterium]
NRDELINGLAKRLADHFTLDVRETVQQLPRERAATTLIDWLFEPSYASNAEAVLALEALIAAAPRYPKVRKHLLGWFDDIADQFYRIVVSEYPSAEPEDCRDVAMGIIGIYFNTDAIEPLGLDDNYRQSARRAALRLLRTLQT